MLRHLEQGPVGVVCDCMLISSLLCASSASKSRMRCSASASCVCRHSRRHKRHGSRCSTFAQPQVAFVTLLEEKEERERGANKHHYRRKAQQSRLCPAVPACPSLRPQLQLHQHSKNTQQLTWHVFHASYNRQPTDNNLSMCRQIS